VRDVVAVGHAAAEFIGHVLGEASAAKAGRLELDLHSTMAVRGGVVVVDVDLAGASVGSASHGRIGVVLLLHRRRGAGMLLLLVVMVVVVVVVVMVLHGVCVVWCARGVN
jgi:hypothetical protein